MEPPPRAGRIIENDAEQREVFAVLEAHFETRTDVRGPYRLIHVDAAKPDGCTQ